MIVTCALSVIEESISSIYREAEIRSESEMYKNIMLEEINSLHKNDTWELSKLPRRKKVIGCNWVFIKKHESQDDETVRYKARLIAKDRLEGVH